MIKKVGRWLSSLGLWRLKGVLLVLWIFGPWAQPWAGTLPSGGTVASVFDGDTIVLNTGEKVRYLGIDTPETAHDGDPADCYAEEARKANADLVLHERVTLKYDTDSVDAHGRLLAYVFLGDGRCVNAELLRNGHAFVFRTSQGFQRLEEFLNKQREALRYRRGMWSACSVKPAASYIGNRRSFVFHRPECAQGKKTSPRNRVSFQARSMGLEEGYRPCRWCKP